MKRGSRWGPGAREGTDSERRYAAWSGSVSVRKYHRVSATNCSRKGDVCILASLASSKPGGKGVAPVAAAAPRGVPSRALAALGYDSDIPPRRTEK